MEALKLELMNPTLYQTISLPSHEQVEESQVYNNSLINSSVHRAYSQISKYFTNNFLDSEPNKSELLVKAVL